MLKEGCRAPPTGAGGVALPFFHQGPALFIVYLNLTFSSPPAGEYFCFSVFLNIPENAWASVYCHLLVTPAAHALKSSSPPIKTPLLPLQRLIETASWGEDPAAIEQQLVSHQRFHNSIQKSMEVDRAREELVRFKGHSQRRTAVKPVGPPAANISLLPLKALIWIFSLQMKKGDRGNLYALDQEWDSLQVNQHQVQDLDLISWLVNRLRLRLLQKMSFGRTQQLQDLQQIMQEMSKEIMWVNDREEEELVFDWGDKDIDQYIPRKQESYSVSGTLVPDPGAPAPLTWRCLRFGVFLLEQKLMSDLEVKEKDLNKLKTKGDALLKSHHPASDKIEVGEPEQVVSSLLTGRWCVTGLLFLLFQAYRDTLQTQWSWLLQITKCIDVHLKENAAYNQVTGNLLQSTEGGPFQIHRPRSRVVGVKHPSCFSIVLQGGQRHLQQPAERARDGAQEVHL